MSVAQGMQTYETQQTRLMEGGQGRCSHHLALPPYFPKPPQAPRFPAAVQCSMGCGRAPGSTSPARATGAPSESRVCGASHIAPHKFLSLPWPVVCSGAGGGGGRPRLMGKFCTKGWGSGCC